jgi:CubicO group peptidase (beta-lactamase class C family)
MRICLLAACAWPALMASDLHAQPTTPATTLAGRIAQVFAGIDPQGPGCNVGVLRDDAWVLKDGFGMANLELAVPLDGSQVHRMGSVSKQFTAMAVLLLADEGRIDLDADVHDYLPALPDYGATVTVNAMLGHVAGMGDYDLIAGSYEGPVAEASLDLRSVAGGPFRLGNEDYLTVREFYDVVKRVPLAQMPQEEFLYSNLAYFLLSMLVEEVSGETLREYAARRIFEPLGMRDTFFSDDPVEIVRNRASGYKRLENGRVVNDMTNLFWVGDGGLHTTLDDMRIWDRYFYSPSLGRDPAALLKKINKPNSDADARGARYANGQFTGEIEGYRAFWHSGGWLGTLTHYVRFPQLRTSLMLMCNDASIDIDTLVDQVLGILLTEDRSP